LAHGPAILKVFRGFLKSAGELRDYINEICRITDIICLYTYVHTYTALEYSCSYAISEPHIFSLRL